MDAVLVEDGNADSQSGLRSRRVYAMQDDASHRYVHARDLFAVRALCSSCVRDEQQVVIQQLLLSACSIARITSPVEGSACMGQACGWAGKGSQRPTRDIFLRWYKVAAERGGYPAPSMRSANLPSMSLAIPVVGAGRCGTGVLGGKCSGEVRCQLAHAACCSRPCCDYAHASPRLHCLL